MDTLSFEPLHSDFGVRVTGLDLSQSLSPGSIQEIREAIDRHSFLVFPDQDVSDDMQIAFTQQLGEPEFSHVKYGQEGVIEYFITIGNIQDDGTKLGNDHKRTRFLTGNNFWHSDSSFREVPTFVSIMCAYEVPDEGGLTEFVSQRAAYKRLSSDLQQTVDPLIAIHDYVYSRSKVGDDMVSSSHAESLPPVRQKLVRKNPLTDEKNIYIGSHAKMIDGWSFEESRELLDELLDETTKPEHVYAHAWAPRDLVIWDNRCLLHRGSGYDADKYRRRMRQTRVMGDGSTLNE